MAYPLENYLLTDNYRFGSEIGKHQRHLSLCEAQHLPAAKVRTTNSIGRELFSTYDLVMDHLKGCCTAASAAGTCATVNASGSGNSNGTGNGSLLHNINSASILYENRNESSLEDTSFLRLNSHKSLHMTDILKTNLAASGDYSNHYTGKFNYINLFCLINKRKFKKIKMTF